MRSLFLSLALAFAGASQAFATQPAGMYAFVDASDAAACAHACDEDSLCVAWSFAGADKCGLSAVAPNGPALAGFVTGLSAHAPAFVRHTDVSDSGTNVVLAAATPPPAPATSTPQAPDDSALLGGPDGGATAAQPQ